MEKEAEILDHEVLSCCLGATRFPFMVAACSNHVARGTVRWSAYHLADEVHLSRSNHVANAGDGVKHSSDFVVAESLFADCGHRYLEDASDATVEEHFKFIEV